MIFSQISGPPGVELDSRAGRRIIGSFELEQRDVVHMLFEILPADPDLVVAVSGMDDDSINIIKLAAPGQAICPGSDGTVFKDVRTCV